MSGKDTFIAITETLGHISDHNDSNSMAASTYQTSLSTVQQDEATAARGVPTWEYNWHTLRIADMTHIMVMVSVTLAGR